MSPDGEMFAPPCRALRCPDCGPTIKVREAVGTIAWQLSKVDHPRYSVLTMPQVEWTPERVRREVAEVVRRFRALGYHIEAAYIVAGNPQGTGYHVDLYSYGDYIPQATWQRANRGQIAHVKAVRSERGQAVGYAFKDAVGYAFKETGEGLARHLALNGGKLYRTTRGFYGDLSRREAESAARAERREQHPGPRWKALYETRRRSQTGS